MKNNFTYLKGLSKYRRTALFYLKYLFPFYKDIDIFLLCKLDQYTDVILNATESGKIMNKQYL